MAAVSCRTRGSGEQSCRRAGSLASTFLPSDQSCRGGGSSNLLRRAEPQTMSSEPISDVDWWRLIGGGGVLRNTRFVRPVVSLRGSWNRLGRASSLWRSTFAHRGVKRSPSPVAFAGDEALGSKCPSSMAGKYLSCGVRRRTMRQNKGHTFEQKHLSSRGDFLIQGEIFFRPL